MRRVALWLLVAVATAIVGQLALRELRSQAGAPDYQLGFSDFSNGAGESSSAAFQLQGTVGGLSSGEASSADYGFQAGFAVAAACIEDRDGLDRAGEAVAGTSTCLYDTDTDACSDGRELGPAAAAGGQRNPTNPWDYFNPSHDRRNRVDDILAVVSQYHDDDTDGNPGLPPYAPGYRPDTDRTLVGPNLWNLGPPNGQQRVDDILNAVYQYHHDCS